MTNKLALIVAVVLGVLSIIGIRLYVDQIVFKYKTETDPVDCFVAARNVEAGRNFTVDDILETQFPRAIADAYRKSRITDKTVIIGARTVLPVEAGQVLQTYHFSTGPTNRTKKLEFGKEYRAVTIPINKVTGVAGLLRPSDNVDVIVNMKLVASGGRDVLGQKELPVTRTVFQGTLVLATDLVVDPNDSTAGQGYGTITLRLRPEEANKLLYALYNGGAIHLVQVNSGTPVYAGFDPVIANDFYNDVKDDIEKKLQER